MIISHPRNSDRKIKKLKKITESRYIMNKSSKIDIREVRN